MNQIKDCIESNFPDGWLKNKSISDLDADYPTVIETTSKKIFNLFCNSVISGEYFLAGSKITKETLDQIEKYVDGKFDEVGDNEDIQEFLEKEIRTQLVYFIKRLIHQYKRFSAQLSLLTTYPFHKINYIVSFESNARDKLKEELHGMFELFVNYINVQLIDHYFSDDDSVVQYITETFVSSP